jgi:hypothetical protein
MDITDKLMIKSEKFAHLFCWWTDHEKNKLVGKLV